MLITTALAVAVAVPATSAVAAPKPTDRTRSPKAEKLAPAKLAKITETPYSITSSDGDNTWKVSGKFKWDENGTRSDGDLVDEGTGTARAVFDIFMADGTRVQRPEKVGDSYKADNTETSVDWTVKGKVTKVKVNLIKFATSEADDLDWKIKSYSFKY